MDAPLLINVIPELAEELKTLLVKAELPGVAEQLDALRIVDRCRCGEDACASFYTANRPDGAWGAGHENVSLNTESGFLILDLVHKKIVHIEVLDKAEIKQKLDKILPLHKE